MTDLPKDLLYTDQHEWVKVEGDIATVGITDFAQQQLGDLTFVELPPVDEDLTKGAEAVAIESCKAAAGVYAPLDGSVTEVNDALEDDPGLVNSDPLGQGWIFKMQISDKGQLDSLMTCEAYQKLLASQE
jgi:glycine cleavage system H protein